MPRRASAAATTMLALGRFEARLTLFRKYGHLTIVSVIRMVMPERFLD